MISFQIKTSEFAHNFHNCAFAFGPLDFVYWRGASSCTCMFGCLCSFVCFLFVTVSTINPMPSDRQNGSFTAEMRRLPFNLLNIEGMKRISGRHLVFVLIIKCLVPFSLFFDACLLYRCLFYSSARNK